MCRWDPRLGRFVPGPSDGTKGTLVKTIDALGRSVFALYENPFSDAGGRIIGYQLGGESDMYDPADGLAWPNKTKDTK
jgi:hypothetical protein